MSERIERLKAAIRQTETQGDLDRVIATLQASEVMPAERDEIATFLERRALECFEHVAELEEYARASFRVAKVVREEFSQVRRLRTARDFAQRRA